MKNTALLPSASSALPDRDQDAAAEHRALRAEQAIGDPAAEEAEQVGAAEVQPVDGAGGLVIEAEAALRDGRHHEQDQHRAHAVVGEALPHLGEEAGGESQRLAEEGATRQRVHDGRLGELCHGATCSAHAAGGQSRESA